ncbi:MAG: hypothetical protein J4F28_02155 [Nitrosopumilaceae archaeon]|nr:hypothetical protein [Nitrosopumilaceae archaeon]
MGYRFELVCKECGGENFEKHDSKKEPLYACLECGAPHTIDDLKRVEVHY